MKLKNKLISNFTLTLLMTFSLATSAVDYSEFATMPGSANDGLSFDLEGNLFVSHINGDLSGSKIYKVAVGGEISIAVSDLSGPLGTDFDSQGNLYVANYNSGVITKITPGGEQSRFSNLIDVNGIVINDQDELFVTSYNASVVYKVAPSGEYEIWLQGNGLNAPVGIALDENDNIYVGNYENGRIFKIDSAKTVTELGSSPDSYGNAYIAYANGMVYATGINSNKIYTVPVDGGAVAELDGSGAAGFSFPNDIVANEDGTKLYVSNFNNNKIIVIENLNEVSSTPTPTPAPTPAPTPESKKSSSGGAIGYSLLLILFRVFRKSSKKL
ncbi:MAG: NHL repeat-containing protein [Colwellia sp.]|nr:NHL repeat-containing protein [Colwellia sp.]